MRFSLGTARQWHWISAAVSMVGMLLFAVTGITLNHASQIPGNTHVHTIESEFPQHFVTPIQTLPAEQAILPDTVRHWLMETHFIEIPGNVSGNFDGSEYYIAWPGPGIDRWLAMDIEMAEFVYESTDRGWVAYFNDLHKGRHTGTVWAGFIDVIAVAIVVFTLTGLWMLIKQASYKPSTWPVTALGFLVPVVIVLIFIH